jgi:hypothetical protein
VIDGRASRATGPCWHRDCKIAKIGNLKKHSANKTIDARGKMLSSRDSSEI